MIICTYPAGKLVQDCDRPAMHCVYQPRRDEGITPLEHYSLCTSDHTMPFWLKAFVGPPSYERLSS